MLQFYFLAIFVNLIGGMYFANDFLAKKFPKVVKVKEFNVIIHILRPGRPRAGCDWS